MAGKKLEPQQAFDLLTRQPVAEEAGAKPDVEDRFDEVPEEVEQTTLRRWLRVVFKVGLAVLVLCMSSGLMMFYLSIANQPEVDTDYSQRPAASTTPPVVISPEDAKVMIEKNLRAFLVAEKVEQRLPYIVGAKAEEKNLNNYYNQRGLRDSPLWKIQQIEPVKSVAGEVWFVLYQDVEKRPQAVSFERVEDTYLLHWSAMKAYCELPWEKFIVQKPSNSKVMRGYLRHYAGTWPLGVSRDDYQCFLIEDKAGLFSELAVMRRDASGFKPLGKLAKRAKHPVTLELRYDSPSGNSTEKRLVIDSLIHLRWQRMSTHSTFIQ